MLVMTSSYTAGLTAFMTSNNSPLPVNSIHDLVERPQSKWVTVSGTALEDFIKVKILSKEVFFKKSHQIPLFFI